MKKFPNVWGESTGLFGMYKTFQIPRPSLEIQFLFFLFFGVWV